MYFFLVIADNAWINHAGHNLGSCILVVSIFPLFLINLYWKGRLLNGKFQSRRSQGQKSSSYQQRESEDPTGSIDGRGKVSVTSCIAVNNYRTIDVDISAVQDWKEARQDMVEVQASWLPLPKMRIEYTISCLRDNIYRRSLIWSQNPLECESKTSLNLTLIGQKNIGRMNTEDGKHWAFGTLIGNFTN